MKIFYLRSNFPKKAFKQRAPSVIYEDVDFYRSRFLVT
jgi:hypothetical protein